jgi:hypothetical protein
MEPSSFTDIMVRVPDFERGLRDWEATCGLLRGAAAVATAAPIRKVFVDDRSFRRAADAERWRRAAPEAQHILRRSFGQFVTLLERCGREGVRDIAFACVKFGEPGWLDCDEADLARLFGDVLPSLPHLEKLRFTWCSVPGAHLKAFAAHLSATSSLLELDLQAGFGGFSTFVPDLADMIRRNASIQDLIVNAERGIGRDACLQIFSSLPHNSTLRSLTVRVQEVSDGAMPLPVHRTSSLRSILIHAETWTQEGKSALARQLKANAVLEELHVVYDASTAPLSPRAWIEALESHNYTLRALSEGPRSDRTFQTSVTDERVVACLRRNERIHQALQQLRGTYHISPPGLLPRAWELVSSLPTLLYRFVRLGDIHALCVLLLVARQQQHQHRRSDSHSNNSINKNNSSSNSKKKRGRPTPPRAAPLLRRSVRAAGLRK